MEADRIDPLLLTSTVSGWEPELERLPATSRKSGLGRKLSHQISEPKWTFPVRTGLPGRPMVKCDSRIQLEAAADSLGGVVIS